MFEAKISQKFRLKNIDETRRYFLEQIEQNELMSKKHKRVCTTLNYIETFLILASTITGCISISAFTSLLGILIGIMSSAIGLKNSAITAEIKKYKPTILKKKRKHDKIVFLAKSINLVISHDEFVLIDNVLKEYDDMKEKINNFNNK